MKKTIYEAPPPHFLEVKYWYFNYRELYFNGFDDLDVGPNKTIENVKEILFDAEN